MGESRSLGILVFDMQGRLLRFGQEVEELTGHGPEAFETCEAWCARLFPDPTAHAIVRTALQALADSAPTGESRTFDFSLPFTTASGGVRPGDFCIALSCPTVELGDALLIVSLQEKVQGRVTRPGPEHRDVLSHALSSLNGAQQGLAAIVEESHQRVITATQRIRGDQEALSQQWDDLFQEAFALARIRDLSEVIRESVEAAYEASRAEVRQADPDRPLAGVSLGKPVALPLGLSLYKLERFWILSTLQALQGNRSDCARHLDIALRTVRNKLGEYKAEGFKIPSSARGRRAKITKGA